MFVVLYQYYAQFSGMLIQQFEDIGSSSDGLVIKRSDDVANCTIQHGANPSFLCWTVCDHGVNNNTRDLQSIRDTIWGLALLQHLTTCTVPLMTPCRLMLITDHISLQLVTTGYN